MLKTRVYAFLNENSYFQKFIYTLIILNVFSLIIASYKEIYTPYEIIFDGFEFFSVIVFSIEYILRFWTADLAFEKGSSFSKRIKFSFSTFGLIDLFAILPFYLPFIFPFDLRVLRILRLFRLLRIFKLGRLSKSLQTITSVLKESKSELSITIFVAFILMILSSTLMFYVENDAQPEKFENIGQSLWWSVATLTTVGYGDIYPITNLGKILSSVIALIGIGFVALPTGIISSAFISRMQSEKEKGKGCKCPKCGTEF
ncbi:ion transporter [Kaistella jeonii]|uniref:Potassium channel protein n=1 Tax=Kaistella jeonii TaxID=266749 RepID=A0A0C1FJ81_9FLAO|nr:ion transporter [Kaistella jeonii]KIA87969.1 potassium channel protein [Kaistella jeonii]SFC07877.1 voltage-gated potassium channel [Kaistella jeonii]VEI95144.1 MlotiK1 channel [Kaistella jeonii]